MPDPLRSALWVMCLSLLLLGGAPAQTARIRDGDQTLTATLAGEFALQAGRLDEAARWYLDAARAADGDAGLAERATRIALLANDDKRAADALALWRQRAPEALPMRGAEVTLALRAADARAARRGLDALLARQGPGDQAGWRYALAALGSGGKDPKLAGQLLGELIDAGTIPQDLQAWLAFGGLAQRLDQPALAERVVAEVVKRFPNEPRVALLRVSQLRSAGKIDEALGALGQIPPATLADPELRMAVAAEYDVLGQPARAAAVLAGGKQDIQMYGLRASLLAKADDKPALTALYVELQKASAKPDPQQRLLLGQVAEFLKRPQEALQWYRSVPGGEQRWQARLRIANVQHTLGHRDAAYNALRALQAEADADDDARRDAYLLEADLRSQDKDGAGELDAFARGLAAFADDDALLYARALAWERRDDIPRAEADFRRILVAQPDNVATLNALGYTLADRTGRYAEALELIDRARVAEPDNPAIIDSYGWVLYRLGRVQDALPQLRRAYLLQKDPEIAAHLGEVLWVNGEQGQARRYFDEARKLDPNNRALQRALRKTGA
jgi:predicted Zn-dependent protease